MAEQGYAPSPMLVHKIITCDLVFCLFSVWRTDKTETKVHQQVSGLRGLGW